MDNKTFRYQWGLWLKKHVFPRKCHRSPLLVPCVYKWWIHCLRRPAGYWDSHWRWHQSHWRLTDRNYRLAKLQINACSKIETRFSCLSFYAWTTLHFSSYQLLSKKLVEVDPSSISPFPGKDSLKTLPEVFFCKNSPSYCDTVQDLSHYPVSVVSVLCYTLWQTETKVQC